MLFCVGATEESVRSTVGFPQDRRDPFGPDPALTSVSSASDLISPREPRVLARWQQPPIHLRATSRASSWQSPHREASES